MGEEKSAGTSSRKGGKTRRRSSPRTAKTNGTGGRDAKLTQDVWEALVKYTAEGLPMTAASQLAGISRRTFYRWMERGEAGEKRYKDFYRDIQEARGRAHRRAVMTIQVAARDGVWQAAAWWLERNYPELYARRDGAAAAGEGTKREIIIRDETEDA